jgi:hypothetical protein
MPNDSFWFTIHPFNPFTAMLVDVTEKASSTGTLAVLQETKTAASSNVITCFI